MADSERLIARPPGDGLTSNEAALRLDRDGPNILPEAAREPAWRQLAGQMVHFFAVLLWAAAALAVLAGLAQIAVAIAIVVILNGTFAFVQERRSEQAVEELRNLLPTSVTVRRDGQRESIDALDLVIGDLVLLEPGDRVSADMRVLTSHGLLLDMSAFSGESAAVSADEHEPLWAGCFVVEGTGEAEVTGTGAATRLADLALLSAGRPRPVTPLARDLHRLVRTIAAIAVSMGLGFFALTFLLATPPSEGVIFAIGVTVALVPEGLLPTTTLSLAMGARRMARNHALVRHLESVESLGATTFICTDKTGTLTRNEMSVIAVWTPGSELSLPASGYQPETVGHPPPDVVALLRAAASCSGGGVVRSDAGTWSPRGDPQEAAIHVAALRVGARDDDETTADVRFAFSSSRRRMSVVRNGRLVVKGAPDSVLPLCDDLPPGATGAVEAYAARGLRVLAVARRDIGDVSGIDGAEEAERNLELLGLLALEDPPRENVAQAISECRVGGMKVAMITGDHPATAAAIAAEVGLSTQGSRVLIGAELPDEDDALGELMDSDGTVVARVDPEDKLRIARALRARGHVVAMTGDGVNDGPALREADVGVAMGGSGTDVAREAADLVLLDDNFATIVTAAAEGRATFANVKRFLTYHLTDNVAELTPFAIWAITGGRFPLALGVMQVLTLDIATDTMPAVALGAEKPRSDSAKQGPASGAVLDRKVAVRAFGILGPTEALMAMSAFTVSLITYGWWPGESLPGDAELMSASGAAFTAVVVGQVANAFACRSSRLAVGRLPERNVVLYAAVAASVAIGMAALLIPPVADLLGQAIPNMAGGTVALATAPAVLAADAVSKRIARRRQAPAEAVTTAR